MSQGLRHRRISLWPVHTFKTSTCKAMVILGDSFRIEPSPYTRVLVAQRGPNGNVLFPLSTSVPELAWLLPVGVSGSDVICSGLGLCEVTSSVDQQWFVDRRAGTRLDSACRNTFQAFSEPFPHLPSGQQAGAPSYGHQCIRNIQGSIKSESHCSNWWFSFGFYCENCNSVSVTCVYVSKPT